MSVKTEAIQNQSSPTVNLSLDASGNVAAGANLTVAGSATIPTMAGNPAFSGNPTFSGTPVFSNVPSLPSSMMFRNRIINGDVRIWQRGTTATGIYSAGSSGYVTADRWCYYSTTSMTSSQSSSVPSGFQYSLKIQRPNAAVTLNQIYAFQVVESVNMIDLAGQTVTLSFWAKAGANFSSSGNILSVFANTGTVADQGSVTGLGGWTGHAQPLYSAVTLTTTWTKYSVTGTIASNALELDAGFYYTPTGTAGADDSFYITGVQLEVGTVATPFERRLYGQELMLCQRYYYRVTAPAVGSLLTTNGISQNATTMLGITQFPVIMRSAPTALEQSGTIAHYSVYTSSSVACNSLPTFASATTWYAGTNATVAANTVNLPQWIIAASTSAYLGWSAEL